MSDVGRYRKVYPRLFRDPRYRGLRPSARELVMYLVAGPQTNRIGLFHFSIATAAEDLSVGADTLRTCLRDVSVTFGWLHDADARVIYIPSWWKWNRPENPWVLEGNLKDLNEVPPSALSEAFARNLQFLPDTWHETFIRTCRTRLATRPPHQEQKQEAGSGSGSGKQKQEHGASRLAEMDDGKRHHLIRIAKDVARSCGSKSDLNVLVDTFYQFQHSESNAFDFKRSEVVEALNTVLTQPS